MDDIEDLSESHRILIESLGLCEPYSPARYEPDPLIEIVERNLLGGFDREKPAVIDEIAGQFADVLDLAQWAGFVDEGVSLESLADAFDAYTPNTANGADDWPSPTESANGMLSLVAGLIRQARGRTEPRRIKLSDGREISVEIGFQQRAASAALYLVVARSAIFAAISARRNSVKAAADTRREVAAAKRSEALAVAEELKRSNQYLSKDDIALKLVERRIYASFSRARDVLRERRDRRDDDSPRRIDDAL